MMRRRILKGAVSNYAGKFTSMGVWFLMTPFLLRQLGPEGYGLWVLVGSITAYGWLLDLGIGNAVVKYTAEHVARGETAEARTVIATALWFYLGLGVIAVVASAALAPLFPRVFDLSGEAQQTARWLVVLMGVNVGITIALAPTSSVLQGLQRYDLYNLVNVLGTLALTGGTIGVLLAGGGLVGMVAMTLPVTVAMRLTNIALIYRVAPELGFGWRGPDRGVARRILAFSAAAFAMRAGDQMSTKTDEIVIAGMSAVSAVSVYAVARKLGELAQIVTEQFLKVLLPVASELDALDDRERLRRVYIIGTRLSLAVFVPVALMLVVFAGPVLTAWVGADFAGGADLVVVLTFAGLIATSQWAAGAILQGMSKHRLLAVTSVCSGAANIALSIVLIGPLGLMGVALGTLIPTTLVSLGVILPYAMARIGVGVGAALRGIWLPGLLPALPMAAVLYVIRHLLDPTSIVALGGTALTGALVYAAGYLAMGATRPERDLVQEVALRVLRPEQTA